MGLPAFDLPIPPLGVEIPTLIHPLITHFAIVLPIFILLLELINLIMRRKGLTATAFVFFTLLIVIFVAAFATGKTDAKEAFDMLTATGQENLKEHKLIGIYLMLSTVILVFAKLFSMALKTWWMKLIYLLILTGFVAAVLYQGKEGGELVYENGANVHRVKILEDKIFDLEDRIDNLKQESKKSEQKQEDINKSVQTKALQTDNDQIRHEKNESVEDLNSSKSLDDQQSDTLKQ